MTLEISRFANLLLAGFPAGNKLGAQATALTPHRKEKEAYSVTVSSMQEKRGASW